MYNFDRKDPPEFHDEVIKLSMSGLSLKEIGDFYSLDPDDWIEWCGQRPLVALSYATGKARGIALAGGQLLNQIKQGKIQAISFYLKTQGGFTEKSVMAIEESLKISHVTPPIIPKDPVEASKTYQQYMKDS